MRRSMTWSAGAGWDLVHPRGGGTLSLTLCGQSLAGRATAAAARRRGSQEESDGMGGPDRKTSSGALGVEDALYIAEETARRQSRKSAMEGREGGCMGCQICRDVYGLMA